MWEAKSASKYFVRPSLSKIMGRSRFEALFGSLTISSQPAVAGWSSAQHRWALFNDFVAAFSDHRYRNVTPSDHLCVDETMIRFYGLGDDWIEIGPPHFVSIEHKPEDGCEVQNLAWPESGIMLRIGIVTGATDKKEKAFERSCNHRTAVLKRLVRPWVYSDRVICADSYSASVQSAVQLLHLGLRFIGVVKTATRAFPMHFLSQVEMDGRGQHTTLRCHMQDTVKSLMAQAWVDRNRR